MLLTDIARSSYLWEAFPGEYPALLETHNRITESVVEARGGEVMKNLGDGYIALFEDAPAALGAALELQQAFAATGLAFSDGTLLQLRAVIHGGALQQLDAGRGWFGTALNRAARICGVAHPGQTLLSGFARQRLSELAPELELLDLGRVRLRDLGEPEQLYQVNHASLPLRDFPALLGMDVRPNNLREQPGSFIGREDELRELRRLLLDEQQRLITLTAPGGYGKSRCANQLCASLLHRYEHGAWTVELAPLADASRIAERTADALGFQFFSAAPLQEQLVNYLRGKQALIHFDNFEHVLEGTSLIADILQDCPRVQCVVTSRVALRLRGEKVVALDPLAHGSAGAVARAGSNIPPAVELFADRALLVNADFRLGGEHLPAVMQLVQRLDGVPLAVELAAAWSDTLSPEELLEELTQQLELTARMTDVPERQRSVRASCDWSWKLLTPEQQTALMQCACFRGGFFVEAAQAVIGVKGMALRALLGGLIEKSWLYTREMDGQTRYNIRDAAAREYAGERLGETRDSPPGGAALGGRDSPVPAEAAATEGRPTEDSLHEQTACAHAQYFSALAAREGPRLNGGGTPDDGKAQQAALRTWKLELENITEAVDTALHRNRTDWLLPIAQWLARYLEMTGGSRFGRERYTALLEEARRLASPELELYAQFGLGRALERLGNNSESRAAAAAAREMAAGLGDRAAEAAALGVLGNVHWLQGDYSAARELHSQCLAIRRELDDHQGEANSLNNLARAHWTQGDYNAAQELFSQALAIYHEIGDRHGEGATLNNLGAVHFKQGGHSAAQELYTQALRIFRELGFSQFEANALGNLGLIHSIQGDYPAAQELFSQSLAIFRELGSREFEANTLGNLGNVHAHQGDYSAARELQTQSLAICREIGDRRGEAGALNSLGKIRHNQGDYNAAGELYSQTLQLRRQIGDKSGIVAACACTAATRAGLEEWRDAAAILNGALAAATELGLKLESDQQQMLDTAREKLDEAVTAGEITAGDLAQWQAEGEAMSLDELVESTLKALSL